MAKRTSDEPKTEQSDAPKADRSETDIWRDSERAAQEAERNAESARVIANSLGSSLAKKLVEQHKGSAVELDGQLYTPKKRASREAKNEEGAKEAKAPVVPFQLVKYAPKYSVDI